MTSFKEKFRGLRLTVAKINLSGEIMRIPKSIKIVGGILLVVLAVSTVLGIVNFFGLTGNANAPSETSNLLQYEWPQLQGNPSFTRFSAGPAPETPDMLWKTNITGIQSFISAFNGKVFVQTMTSVFALDRTTGNVIWNTTLPEPNSWLSVYKIDDAHLVVGNSCLDPETGNILWESATFSARTGPLFTYNVYSPEEKLFYTLVNSTVYAWDFSDPSQPPTVAWKTYVSGSGLAGSGIQYGDGKVFPGSYEPHQIALDAKTGDVLWDTETKSSMLFSGSYYEERFFRGGSHDNILYCFNASSGDVLWEYNPQTEDGYFCVGTAVAYGMVYALNRDGYLYALDIDTGDVVWKYQGPGPLMFPGTPTVADGKIYATTGQNASYAGYTSKSEFACLDAYTGQPLWTLPIEAFAPRESVAVAYGNLYLIPADVTTMVDSESGDEYSTINQVWAIGSSWPMWRHDPAHSAIGQSGPANLTLSWNYTTNGAVISSPSIVDYRVYVGSQDQNLYCLDARSGSFIWNFSTNSPLKSSPAVVDSKVYVGPDDGNVYCLDAYNGSLIWEQSAGGIIQANFASAVILRSSPIVVNGRVYVGSLDTNVYCLDANNGDISWTYKTEGYITSSPAVADGAVYVISQEPDSGALYKLNANDGSLIWKKAIPYQLTFMGGTDMQASPTVGDGMVFASSNTQEYFGINAATGDVEWTYRDETALEFIVCSTVYKDGLLFLIDKFSIVCVNATNGHTIWSTYLGEELYVSPSYADDKLYVVTDQRSVYVLNATNGDKLGYFSTSSNSWCAPSIYEGRVYVGNNDWNIYCLAGYPTLNTNIAIELTVPELALGESTTVFGRLTPGIVDESIMLTFVMPDGSDYTAQVVTSEKGSFNFTYTPDVVGNWTVSAQWQADKGYYTSAHSEPALMEVNAPPASGLLPGEYVYAVVIAFIIIIVILLLGYIYAKRSRSNSDSFSESSKVYVSEFFVR